MASGSALRMDKYTSSVLKEMYRDSTVNIKEGKDSVNENGDLAYCDFGSHRKDISGFDKPDSWYTSVMSKWKKKWAKYADDARDIIDTIKESWKAMLYQHEDTEDFYQGKISHPELIYRDMKSTPEDSNVSLAQVASADIGLENNANDAIELDDATNIREIIADYKKRFGEKYEIFKETIEDILNIPKPAYAYVKEVG